MNKPLIAAALILLAAAPASAAVQTWHQLEAEATIPKWTALGPDGLSFETDVRYSSDRAGLERVQLRWGPRWNVGNWLELGLNHTPYLQQSAPGTLIQEQRLELQPTFMGAFGPLAWEDRNRLEYRMRPDSTRWRYRNQLRLEAPVAPAWSPFVAGEAFVDLEAMILNEHRLTLGLAHTPGQAGWELSYTLRTGLGSGGAWSQDHLVALGWEADLELRGAGSTAAP